MYEYECVRERATEVNGTERERAAAALSPTQIYFRTTDAPGAQQ